MPKDQIQEEIQTILAQMPRRVMKNLCSRVKESLLRGGGHHQDTVFKK
jgi:hypothetical protein